MNIDFSIWGIRRGFEPAGFLHSHSYTDVLALHKDRFRNLGNAIGGQGFYLLNRLPSRFVCTYVNSAIREFVPNGSPRPGYVGFSLIIPGTHAFSMSPRRVLEQLSAFYQERVGDTQYNNFTAEDIRGLLSGLSLVPCRFQSAPDSSPAYAYYEQAADLDDLLTGNSAYARYGELALIPGQRDSATGKFREINFIDSFYQANPRLVDLSAARLASEQEREKERSRRLQEEEENKNRELWKAEAAQFDPQLDNLLRQGKLAEARELVNQCRPELRKFLPSLKRLEEKEKELQEAENFKSIAKEITKLEARGDLSAAHQLWKHNFGVDTHLSSEVRQAIRNYEQKIKNKETEEREKARREANRKKILQLSLMGLLVAAVLGTGAYFGYQWYIQEPEIAIQVPPKDPDNPDSIKRIQQTEDSIGKKDSSDVKMQIDSTNPAKISSTTAKLKGELLSGKVIEISYPNRAFENIAAWKAGKKFFKLNLAKNGYLWADQKDNANKFGPVEKSANDALNTYLGLNYEISPKLISTKQEKGSAIDNKKSSVKTKSSKGQSSTEKEAAKHTNYQQK
jgi:hypothetical protein